MITDGDGIPLVVQTGPANERDDQRVPALLDTVPAIAGPRGRPRRKPVVLQGDAGYGFPALIRMVRQRRIVPLFASRGTPARPVEHGSGLGRTRYAVERTVSWIGNYRRIKFCDERCGDRFQGFHELAASLVCAQRADAANPF